MSIDTSKIKDQARDGIAEALGDAYDCMRVWSAWGVGTMGPGDFALVVEDESRLEEITDAALAPALSVIDAQAVEITALRQPWISVQDRLPEPGVYVMVHTPPQPEDWPNDVRLTFDYIDPDFDGDVWYCHAEHYEHFCCVAKGGDVEWRGPSEKAPYTHWMPIPAPPVALSGESNG